MRACIKVNARHDRNGNPQRGWVILAEDGDFFDFVDEGYNGTAILYRKYPEFKEGYYPVEFGISKREYRELKSVAKVA